MSVINSHAGSQITRRKSMVSGNYTNGNSDFMAAVRDPFCVDAYGSRVPSALRLPTQVFHMRGTITISSSASGNCGLLMLPNPLVSFVDMNRAVTGSSLISTSTATAFAANPYVYGSTTRLAMRNLARDYRVVAWGFIIRSTQVPTACTGSFTLASVPCVKGCPTSTILENNAAGVAGQFTAMATGYTAAELYSSSMVNYEGCVRSSTNELIGREILVRGSVNDLEFYKIKPTDDTQGRGWLGGGADVSDYIVATGGSINNGTLSDQTNMCGGMAFNIFATGLPNSTPCFEIEYIYHLEGVSVPAINSTTPQPSGSWGSSMSANNLMKVLSSIDGNMAYKVINNTLGLLAGAGSRGITGPNPRALKLLGY